MRVRVEQQPSAHHLGSLRRLARCGNLDGEAEAVEQLGPQLALLRIHRPDEHEFGRVGDGYAVALHRDGAHRGRIEQQVDQMVVQQIDLVDVQDAAMRPASRPGSKCTAPSLSACWRSIEPATRSSVAPTGSSTSRTGRVSTDASGPKGPSGESGFVSAGSEENRSPAMTSIGGSIWVRARTSVDFAVPFSPRTSTPPMPGCTTQRISANAMSSSPPGASGSPPSTAGNGYSWSVGVSQFAGAPVFTLASPPCRPLTCNWRSSVSAPTAGTG